MADLTPKTISELPAASSVGDSDLFPVSQSSASKKVTWTVIKNAIASAFFPLTVARGGTEANNKTNACLNLGTFDLGRGTNIPNNSDLNNYTTDGVYYVLTSSNAATIDNTPTTNGGYKLVVQHGAVVADPTPRLFQWALVQATNYWYVRNYNGTTWSAWDRILNTSSLPLAIGDGGTGAATVAGIKSNIGLDSLRSQYYSSANNTSVDVAVESATGGFLFTTGAGVSSRGIYAYGVSANGAASFSGLFEATGLSLTAGTNKITISNSSGAVVRVIKLWCE